ncbi:MAG: GNAT family N-acetyltransferase [Acidimicrobiia bacterium]|nr:MAG: GNAT family N-acetyltransferase [Acidimicrobiia bacterium]
MFSLKPPAGYRAVTATDEIVDDIAERYAFAQHSQSGRAFLSPAEAAAFLREGHIDVARDVALLVSEFGDVAGCEFLSNRPPHVAPHAFGAVLPDHTSRGVGSFLMEWVESRAVERLGEAPAGTRVVLTIFSDDKHAPSARLLADAGFETVRYGMSMERPLQAGLEPPALPDGVELRTFTPGEDDEAAYLARSEAFRDSYGFVDVPVEIGLESFRENMGWPGFDPALWWNAYSGGEIVAHCWAYGEHGGDVASGYVFSLGVARPWRGRGLGRALLETCFAELARRGKTAVALDVDAQSLTGATRLYESVGMVETFRAAVNEKELRAGVDLATRTLE